MFKLRCQVKEFDGNSTYFRLSLANVEKGNCTQQHNTYSFYWHDLNGKDISVADSRLGITLTISFLTASTYLIS
jgi:hypothetical protein